MMRVTFSGNSLAEIKTKMGSFLLECQPKQSQFAASLPKLTEAKKGRPKMSPEEHLAKREKDELKEVRPSRAVTMETFEELKSVFLEYHDAFGDEAAKSLLGLHACDKLSELDKRSYHKFIRICKDAIKESLA